MTIRQRLHDVRGTQYLELPKGVTPPHGVPEEDVIRQATGLYQIHCSHLFNAPLRQEQLASAERRLHRSLPEELVNLLSVSNGAGLFRVHYAPRHFDDY